MSKQLIIIDDTFPQLRKDGGFSGRKHSEYFGLMEEIENCVSVCPTKSVKSKDEHSAAVAILAKNTPWLVNDRMIYGELPESFHGALAYIVFPQKAILHLDYLERHELSFVCTIYPGGGFVMWGPSAASVEAQLNVLARHRLFRGFLTHHDIIAEHLEKFFPSALIHRINGGFSQASLQEIAPRTRFGYERDTLDVCFVANRYDPLGLGKGFDVFLEVARKTSKLVPQA